MDDNRSLVLSPHDRTVHEGDTGHTHSHTHKLEVATGLLVHVTLIFA